MRTFAITCTMASIAALVAGCSTTPPNRYEEIGSSSQLRPTVDERRDRIPYSVDKRVAWGSYSHLILDPVSLYGGRDGQFEEISEEEKAELSSYMYAKFAEQIKQLFILARNPQAGTLRVRLTLTGATPNTAFVSTFTRFDLVGAPYNVVQGIRRREGAFIGSVMYSVEVFDALSGELLRAFIAEQFPNAMNVASTVGRLKAARVGIDKGAEQLLAMLR